MPSDQHVNRAEEPSPASSPSRPEDPAADGTAFMPGVPRDPASRVRIPSQVARIGRSPDNHIVVSELGVSKQHAELRRTPAGRFSIIDLGSHNGTYVNGTRISEQELQELNEGDIIAIGHAAFRLAGGELVEYVDDGTDKELLAGMIVTRLERWLELEGAFEVPGVGQVELAGEVGWEPGSGTLYLRRTGDGRVWRVDVPVGVRPATPEEVKTALERERDLAAELRRQLDAREHRIDSMEAELRALAAGNPAVLPVLDRLGIRPEPEA
jgi:FHA domain